MEDGAIEAVFLQYCNIGGKQGTLTSASLEGAKWGKVCRESKLAGGSLTPMEVDNIFMRVTRGGKRMSWGQFGEALDHVAATKKITREAVEARLCGADPTAGVTNPGFVRHHDDKSTYTGVYRAGGPRNLSGRA